MKHQNTILGTLAAGALLALPAAASAHPSVYTDVGRIIDSNGPPVTVKNETRYVVTNHGFTYVLRESNGAGSLGVMDYKKLPGAYRNQAGFTKARLLAEGDSAAQAHATCRGVPALAAEAAILAWQGTDPFYNYVPFQATSAGLEDNPADWLDDVKARTGVTLTPSTDLAAACSGIGGTLVAADATQTTSAALNSGLLEEATAPLEADVAKLKAEKAALEAQLGTPTDLTAARAEIARLKLEAAPLKAALAKATTSALDVTLTGPASRSVKLRAVVGPKTQKQLGLKSRVLGSGTVTTGADGKAAHTLELSASRALKRATQVKLEAVAGDRVTAAYGKLA